MNARQAYLALLNGNKIRRQWYRDGVFIKMTEDGRVECSTGGSEKLHTLIVADDYEIYTPPKRKVRYAPVIFKGPYSDELCRSTALFASEAEAIEWCKHPLVNGKFIQVDWDNAVEIEE
jgi:hypothetical protein